MLLRLAAFVSKVSSGAIPKAEPQDPGVNSCKKQFLGIQAWAGRHLEKIARSGTPWLRADAKAARRKAVVVSISTLQRTLKVPERHSGTLIQALENLPSVEPLCFAASWDPARLRLHRLLGRTPFHSTRTAQAQARGHVVAQNPSPGLGSREPNKPLQAVHLQIPQAP